MNNDKTNKNSNSSEKKNTGPYKLRYEKDTHRDDWKKKAIDVSSRNIVKGETPKKETSSSYRLMTDNSLKERSPVRTAHPEAPKNTFTPSGSYHSYVPSGIATTDIRNQQNRYTNNVSDYKSNPIPKNNINQVRSPQSSPVRLNGSADMSVIRIGDMEKFKLNKAEFSNSTSFTNNYISRQRETLSRPSIIMTSPSERISSSEAPKSTFSSMVDAHRRYKDYTLGGQSSAGGNSSPKDPHSKIEQGTKKYGGEKVVRENYASRMGLTIGSGATHVVGYVGRSVYSTMENGDYDGLREAEKMKRNAAIAVNSVDTAIYTARQISNIRTVSSHTMTRLGNAGRYLKGTDFKTIENELKTLSEMYGPLSQAQANRLEYLNSVKKHSQYKTFSPVNMKQYNQQLKTYGILNKSSQKQLRREINELKKLKVLNPEQVKRLSDLKGLMKLRETGILLKGEVQSKRIFSRNMNSLLQTAFHEGENSGVDALLATSNVLSNRYARTVLKTSYRVTYVSVRGVSRAGWKGAKFVGDKTGITKAVNETKIVKEAKEIGKVTTEAVVKGLHGGIYNTAKTKVVKYTPPKIKTAVNKASITKKRGTALLNKAKNSKVAKAASKAASVVKAPFKFVKKIDVAVKAISTALKKYILIGIGALLGAAVVCGAIVAIFGTLASVFASDSTNIQKYVDYLVDKQDVFIEKVENEMEALREANNSLNESVTYFTHKQSLTNGKEMLSMAAVWGEQEWPEWYEFNDTKAMKKYIDTLFKDTHIYRFQLSAPYSCPGCKTRTEWDSYTVIVNGEPQTRYYSYEVEYCDGDHRDVDVYITVYDFTNNDIFHADSIGNNLSDPLNSENWEGWTEGNIEWCKNFYNQDWLELYGVSFGGDNFQASVLTPEQTSEVWDKIEAQFPNLSQSRRNLISSALSLCGRVPYFWGGGHHQNLDPGIDPAWGVETRPITAAGSDTYTVGSYWLYGLDCSGFTRWCILNSTGRDSMYAGAQGQRSLGTAVSSSRKQPGDFANINGDGHVGIYLYTEGGKDYFIHCSPSVNGVGINAPGYFTKFYTPRGIN